MGRFANYQSQMSGMQLNSLEVQKNVQYCLITGAAQTVSSSNELNPEMKLVIIHRHKKKKKKKKNPPKIKPHPTGQSLLLLHCFFSCSVLQELSVHFVCRQLNIPDHRSTDETVFHRQHVWIFLWICDTDVCELNVQVLVNRMKCSADAQVVFELHHHILPHQRL